jgi:hypothetical protein
MPTICQTLFPWGQGPALITEDRIPVVKRYIPMGRDRFSKDFFHVKGHEKGIWSLPIVMFWEKRMESSFSLTKVIQGSNVMKPRITQYLNNTGTMLMGGSKPSGL